MSILFLYLKLNIFTFLLVFAIFIKNQPKGDIMWILILSIVTTTGGAAVTTQEFQSHKACSEVGKAFVEQNTHKDLAYASYICAHK